MKSLLGFFLLLVCVLSFNTLSAQDDAAAMASSSTQPAGIIDQNSLIFQGGIGLGGYSYAYGSGLPLINIAMEKGLPERVGPGYIGVGGYLGYKHASYNYASDYRWSYTDILIAARGAYHPDFAHSEKLDAYAGIALGVNIYRFNDTEDDILDSTSTGVLWGGYLGARYMFSDKIGAYGELGYGLGYLNVGVVVKLK